MKIGIDLDGVVFDSEKDFRVYSEIYDIQDLKANNIIDGTEFKFQDRYKWTKEELNRFLEKYHKYIIENSNYMPGAEGVLKLLKEEGHELIIITARGGLNEEMIEVTKNRLRNTNMDIFDKYYWKIEEKSQICKQEEVDIMIDDYFKNVISISNLNIKTIYLKDSLSEQLEQNKYIKTLTNWGEIYRYIKELGNK